MTPRKAADTLPNGFRHCTIAAHIANLACNSAGEAPQGQIFEHPDVYDKLLDRMPSLHQAIENAGQSLEPRQLHDYEEVVEAYSMETFSNLSESDAERVNEVMLEIVKTELAHTAN